MNKSGNGLIGMKRSLWLAVLGGAVMLAHTVVADPVVLERFDALTGWTVWDQAWGGKADFQKAVVPPSGGGAILGIFPGVVYKELTGVQTNGCAAWEKSAGLSFWVKGDGSDLYGCLAVGPAGAKSWEHNFGNSSSYVHYFPLKNTTWHKVTVAWRDFVPEEDYPAIGVPGGMSPAAIRVLRLGSRWAIHHGSAKIPRHEYSIGPIQFEKTVPTLNAKTALAPFAGVVAKLKKKQPVRILCLGDSITAGQGVQVGERYANRLQAKLRTLFGYDAIVVECRGVGAARITDARAWVERDFYGVDADLITIMYGTNDSVIYKPAFFAQTLNDYLDRIAVVTHGKTTVLLLATIPGGQDRYRTADPLAQAIREVAAQRGLPCCDLQKAYYDLGETKARAMLPTVHPTAEGHELMATTMADFMQRSAGIVAK